MKYNKQTLHQSRFLMWSAVWSLKDVTSQHKNTLYVCLCKDIQIVLMGGVHYYTFILSNPFFPPKIFKLIWAGSPLSLFGP